jgi:hypothetical protein
VIGLVDAMIIGVFLQANPTLTFRNDLKDDIMEAMSDATPISIFQKRVKEPSNNKIKIHFTNGLAIKVSIADPKKAGEFTETLSKAMEYLNENGCHPILSSKVFLPFGTSAAIDNETFHKLIRMQNEHLRNTKHVDVGPSGQDPRTEDTGLRSSSLLALQPRIRQAGSCESAKGIGASRTPQPSKKTTWRKDVSYAHVLKRNRRCE